VCRRVGCVTVRIDVITSDGEKPSVWGVDGEQPEVRGVGRGLKLRDLPIDKVDVPGIAGVKAPA
jgi:hypothetical protein